MPPSPLPIRIRLQKKARRIYLRSYVLLVRESDRAGGPRLVSLMLKPLLAYELWKRRRDYWAFRQLRASVPARFRQGNALRQFYRMMRDWQETLATALLYDRLGSTRWARRVRCSGTLPESQQRPVVLVFLHFGSFGVLRYWLRARGLPVATLVWVLPQMLVQYGQAVREAGDKNFGLEGVPHSFSYSGDLRTAMRFLQPGRVLAMALDGKAVVRLPVRYEAGGRALYLNDGAVRMAQMRKAVLLPVTVLREGAFRFEFRFGQPVPEALVQAEDPGEAMRHLVTHFWAELEHNPSGLTTTSLEAFGPHSISGRSMWP